MPEIIFQNNDFIVIHKQPNTNFHSEGGEIGVFEELKQFLRLSELYPVHRLDKITSGLLVMAKNKMTNDELCDQFKNKLITKFYVAISQKKPKKKQGAIIGDMAPSRRGAFKLLTTKTNPAITQFFSKSLREGMRLFLLHPLTGKTHQLRVALKSLGSAILGDPLYSDGEACGDRAYLHAYFLGFSVKGERYEFSAVPNSGEYFTDEIFRDAFKEYQNPCSLSWPKIS
jgi:tRNA pseudouridine32 synthase/23S rRNA pseudouridine746 synthase